jgi:putative effector of murein hydrolase
MSKHDTADAGEHASWIIAWFIFDAIVALAPPLYWIAGSLKTSVLGIPVALLYFVGVAVFITASIVVAYVSEARAAEAR